MSKKVGAEAIGLYQLICSVYFFWASFSISGISLAVTRLVANSMAKYSKTVNSKYGDPEAKAVLKKCLIIGVAIGALTGIIMFFGAGFFSEKILMDSRALLPLKFLAPSLPFLAFSACFRGYFFATRQIIKTATEQLFEQIIEIVIFIFLIDNMATGKTEYACCAIVIGTSLAEVLSCFYSYILYVLPILKIRFLQQKINKKAKRHENVYPGMLKKILAISLPITASSCLKTGLGTVENALIPAGFKKFGVSLQKSLYDYGMITGMVMPIISFPAVLITAFSTLLVTEMSESKEVNRKSNINNIATKITKFTCLFSIFFMGLFWRQSELLSNWIYGNDASAMYIRIFAPLVPLSYISNVIEGMLKGLGEQVYYLSCNIFNSIITIILIYILLPQIGIKGLIIAIFASEIFDAFFSLLRIIIVAELRVSLVDWIIKPALCSFFSCLAVKLISKPFHLQNLNAVATIFLTLLLYLALLSFIKAIKFKIRICYKSPA